MALEARTIHAVLMFYCTWSRHVVVVKGTFLFFFVSARIMSILMSHVTLTLSLTLSHGAPSSCHFISAIEH